MGATVKISLNRKALRSMLKQTGPVDDAAERIAAAAGHGNVVHTEVGRNRARSAIVTETMGARRREATNRALTRAIDAGR